MGFLCLKNALPVRTFALALLSMHWMGVAEVIAQVKEQPTKSSAKQQEATRAQTSSAEPQPQTDEKSEPAGEAKPESSPEPEPPTDEEKKLVQRLLIEADSTVYETRRSAQLQLINLGVRLPVILKELDSPVSIEAKAAVNAAIQRLDERRFTLVSWHLTVWPKEGEKLDLGPSTIAFNKDGSFDQSGQGNGEPETWQFNRHTQKLTLSLNAGYAIYIGSEDEKGNFVGDAKNIKDEQWHFKLAPIGRPK